MLRPLALAVVLVAALAQTARAVDPAVVGTISFTGAEPLAIAVHEGLDHVFVTEDNAGTVHTYNGATLAAIETATVGGSAFDVAVNETNEKVYVASDVNCCTTGMAPGTGTISVIDADTGDKLTEINPGAHTNFSSFALANDEVHDRVYVAFRNGVGVINPATDAYTTLVTQSMSPTRIAVNTVTDKAYIDGVGSTSIMVVDGSTGGISTLSLANTNGSGPLDVEVGEPENKLYVTMLHQPDDGHIGILVIDRDTNAFKFVGAEDLEPLVFNQSTNRLFTGVQVGQLASIVEGDDDSLTYVDMEEAGIGASAVRASTDNAYHASSDTTVAVNGTTRCSLRLQTGTNQGGGIVSYAIAINQTTGRVYVSNDQRSGVVKVIADGTVPCDTTPPQTTIDSGPPSLSPGRTVALYFSSSETGSTFECSLDSAPFATCTTPAVYYDLADGPHAFQVRATDKKGNTDATPAVHEFTIGYPPFEQSTPPPSSSNPFPSFPSGSGSSSTWSRRCWA